MTGRCYTVDRNHLVLAVARGDSVAAWARANNVPKSTVYRWARSPEVRRTVEAARRGVIERAAGILASRADWALDQLAKIARNAESESVRLAAYRTLTFEMGLSRFRKLNPLARFPDSTPLGEAYFDPARREPRPPGIMMSDCALRANDLSSDVHPARREPRPPGIRKGHLKRRIARLEAQFRGLDGRAVPGSELPKAGNASKCKQRASRRNVIPSLPPVSGECRPTCAQGENRDSGDKENR
jgi:hypothetical protein